jgi:hypothetical protein
MPYFESSTLIDLMRHLETLWRDLDTLFGSLMADESARSNGSGRILADVSTSLADFDREVVVAGLEHRSETRWPEIPIERPSRSDAPSTLQACIDQMRSARQAVRAVVSTMADTDLAQPIWLSIHECGWVPVHEGLEACRWHTWSCYMEACLRLKRDAPLFDPATTHAALNFILQFWLPCVIDRQAASQLVLQIKWTFTGPGGGQWTMDIANGQAGVREGQSFHSDLSFTQSPATFVKTIHRLHDPMTAMLTGEVRVRGFERMGDFERLFPAVVFGLPGA